MDKNWLTEQIAINVEQWDHSLTTFYPETKLWMSDPVEYLDRLTVKCNYLNAVKQLNWKGYLPEGAKVLDVGCGGGWLSAYLSNYDKVDKITAIDSSKNYLDNFVPEVVKLNGLKEKVETVQGLFGPLLVAKESIDLIVISSALHHAESVAGVLKDFFSALKPGGRVIVLNETPAGGTRYLLRISKAFAKILRAVISKQYQAYPQKISTGGFLYDPYLGDVDYPLWYWKEAIHHSGLKLEAVHDSGLTTVVGAKGRNLIHFICRK